MPRNKEINEKMRVESIRKIVESSTRLFAEKGFSKCKMTEIADAAEMSVGNLYWYYKSKKAILKDVLQVGFEQQKALFYESISLNLSTEDKMDYLLDRYIIMCRELNHFLRVYINLAASGDLHYLKEFGIDTIDIGKGYHQLLINMLDESKRSSYSDEELNLLPVFFFSFFSGLMLVYGTEWHSIKPERIKDAVKRMLDWKG